MPQKKTPHKMTIEIDTTFVLRPLAEVLDKETSYERQLELSIQEHNNSPFKSATCYYTETVYPLAKDGETRFPPPQFSVNDYSEEKWREEQGCRVLVPMGTRVLLRRQQHESTELGTIIQDTMMFRVDQPYRWECLHVFYTQEEGTPFPIQTRKRKYEDMF